MPETILIALWQYAKYSLKILQTFSIQSLRSKVLLPLYTYKYISSKILKATQRKAKKKKQYIQQGYHTYTLLQHKTTQSEKNKMLNSHLLASLKYNLCLFISGLESNNSQMNLDSALKLGLILLLNLLLPAPN